MEKSPELGHHMTAFFIQMLKISRLKILFMYLKHSQNQQKAKWLVKKLLLKKTGLVQKHRQDHFLTLSKLNISIAKMRKAIALTFILAFLISTLTGSLFVKPHC